MTTNTLALTALQSQAPAPVEPETGWSNWSNISTAPRNGRYVFVGHPGRRDYISAYYSDDDGEWVALDSGPVLVGPNTVWHPYPEPPGAVRQSQTPAPLPMLLWCPRCGAQHIDAPDEVAGWTNPVHRSHLCHACGCIWRPADVPTTGVAAIETRGQKDTWDGQRAQAPARRPLKTGREHLTIDGLFQSDKYPWCPAGFVPLKQTDPMARDLLAVYAERRRLVDAAFADDLLEALAPAPAVAVPFDSCDFARRYMQEHPGASIEQMLGALDVALAAALPTPSVDVIRTALAAADDKSTGAEMLRDGLRELDRITTEAREEGRQEGRRAGLEEAAQWHDDQHRMWEDLRRAIRGPRRRARADAEIETHANHAAAIRALIDQPCHLCDIHGMTCAACRHAALR